MYISQRTILFFFFFFFLFYTSIPHLLSKIKCSFSYHYYHYYYLIDKLFINFYINYTLHFSYNLLNHFLILIFFCLNVSLIFYCISPTSILLILLKKKKKK